MVQIELLVSEVMVAVPAGGREGTVTRKKKIIQ